MINIAVDGFSGSGKGELCKGLSEKLNLKHLDTGAILRAMGLYFYEHGIFEISDDIILKHMDNILIKIDFLDDKQITVLNGKDVSTEIRKEEIGQMASKVAVNEKAMKKLIEISRNFAENYDCILDGRNITSEVMPDADVKIFLTASLETRALRRFNEVIGRGNEAELESVKASLAERDFRDTHRDFSPMIQTPDSFLVDNTNMTISETIDFCFSLAKEKLAEAGKLK